MLAGIKDKIRVIKDFPKEGILFRDITTALKDANIMKSMVDYIYEHYNESITLEDIAASADISRSKCSVLFHKYAETSPIDFLNAYRLEMAAGQLCNTGDTVASIAFACGFNQQSYFSRMFVREYGMTPKAYRQAHQSAR